MPSRAGIRRHIRLLKKGHNRDISDLRTGKYPKTALIDGSVSKTRSALSEDYKRDLKRYKNLLKETRNRKPKRKGLFDYGP